MESQNEESKHMVSPLPPQQPLPGTMEPSEEFPILFGLLTKCKKETPHPSRDVIQQSFRRPLSSFHSFNNAKKTLRRLCLVEPDSSTPDDESTSLASNVTSQVNHLNSTNSIPSSPLLILRLTSKSTKYQSPDPSISGAIMNRTRSKNSDVKVNQSHKHRRTSQKTCEDECLPSSTTNDDDDFSVSPFKRLRVDDEEVQENVAVISASTSRGQSPSSMTAQDNHSNTIEEINTTTHCTLLSNTTTSSVFYESRDEERPYTCSHCDLKFTRQFHLLRHLAIHEARRGFKCHSCNTAFYRKDNLLLHQQHCQFHKGIINPINSNRSIEKKAIPQSRISRSHHPRNLDELLDQDSYDGKYNEALAGNYIQLPCGLEINEIQVSSDSNERAQSNNHDESNKFPPVIIPPLDPPPGNVNRRCIIERVNIVEEFNESPQDGNLDEVYPCGHCNRTFDTFSNLLKHTASQHIKNPKDGTFHFEIETIIDEV